MRTTIYVPTLAVAGLAGCGPPPLVQAVPVVWEGAATLTPRPLVVTPRPAAHAAGPAYAVCVVPALRGTHVRDEAVLLPDGVPAHVRVTLVTADGQRDSVWHPGPDAAFRDTLALGATTGRPGPGPAGFFEGACVHARPGAKTGRRYTRLELRSDAPLPISQVRWLDGGGSGTE